MIMIELNVTSNSADVRDENELAIELHLPHVQERDEN